MLQTSNLLVGQNLAGILTLGDNQYESGLLDAFMASYDPTWGRVKGLIHPAPGNHEYISPGAAGYYAYFGSAAGNSARGYYSFDIGTWHFIALNSNCSAVGGCGVGSPQEQWLKADLAAHNNLLFAAGECKVVDWQTVSWGPAMVDAAYFIGSGLTIEDRRSSEEELVREYHEGLRAHGIREFVVGTGGKSHYGFLPLAIEPNSEVRDSSAFGVLRLTLHPNGYDWNFAPEQSGGFTDRGSEACR